MKKYKKWFGIAGAIVLVLLVCAGVWMQNRGGSLEQEEAIPCISIAIPSVHEAKDTDLVEEKINEILGPRYGYTMHILYIPMENWRQQLNLLLVNQEVDIMAYMTEAPLSLLVKEGRFEVLDEYVKNASGKFREIWNEENLLGTKVDGKIYAIPSYRNYGNYIGLNIEKEIAGEYGIQSGQRMSMEEISDFLYDLKEKYPDRYPLVPQGGDALVNGWTWDGLGDSRNIGVLSDCGQSLTVENIFDTEDFREFCSYTRQWYLDGLIDPDILNNTIRGDELVKNKKGICYFENYANLEQTEVVRTVAVEPWAVSNSYIEVCYGINAESSHKEMAWKAMEMLFTDSEVNTLLVDGIRDVHYEENSDGTIAWKPERYEDYQMADQYYFFPYCANTPPLQGEGADFWTKLKFFNKNIRTSKAVGFSFDNSKVLTEYQLCEYVIEEYYTAILSGAVDPGKMIERADQKLKEAGIDKVIQEKQRQLDLFLAGETS